MKGVTERICGGVLCSPAFTMLGETDSISHVVRSTQLFEPVAVRATEGVYYG